jgi:hypothetical protein
VAYVVTDGPEDVYVVALNGAKESAWTTLELTSTNPVSTDAGLSTLKIMVLAPGLFATDEAS